MKKFFFFGALGLALFEIARVYCIMPMPGSQQMESIDLAFFLHQFRWLFRALLLLTMFLGLGAAWKARRWLVLATLLVAAGISYEVNTEMVADRMFYQPTTLCMADAANNKVHADRLVLGVEAGGQASAYPLQFIGYHHQVRDTVGGKPLMITYCTVCRTGRVFVPEVGGKAETFRLVGMDHFNAMLEDKSTGSWWRQVTGEAIAGPLKGQELPEWPSTQMSLATWLALHPNSRVMQPDSMFKEEYASMETYDTGLGRGPLTGTDTISWHDKSWVVGVVSGRASKAYDWNRLKRERLVIDTLDQKRVLVALAADGKSFVAFALPEEEAAYTLENDTIKSGAQTWNLLGANMSGGAPALKRLPAYQEFWHSWSNFHPHTNRY